MSGDISKLTTEKRNPGTMDLDEMTPEEIIKIMNQEDAKAVRAVSEMIPQIVKAIEKTTSSLKRGGRIIYIGAGTSGRLGILDAAECPPTFGVDPSMVVGLIAGGEKAFLKAVEGAEDNPDLACEDLKEIKAGVQDTVISIAASGRTPYCIGGLKHARKAGCSTVSISCNKNAEQSKYADVAIEVETGPEVITGSTRLKAGTAEKMILNMISTVSMIEIGKVYENLMVDVVQTNEKLHQRAENIVEQATGCSREEAIRELELSDGDAKLSIVHYLLKTDLETARQRLKEAGGHIGAAIGEKGSI